MAYKIKSAWSPDGSTKVDEKGAITVTYTTPTQHNYISVEIYYESHIPRNRFIGLMKEEDNGTESR